MPKTTAPDSSLPRRPDRDRRVRQNARIARVLGVLNLIQSRGRWDLNAIAAELECSDRTVRRDLEVLEFAGVPFYFDERERCYRVRKDFKFPAMAITAEEALGQALATAFSKAPGLNIGPGAKPTTRKLAASSQEQLQTIIADALRLIEVFDLKLADHSKHHETIHLIQCALLNQNQITGVYKSPYETKQVKLTIHPYRLCLVKQAWYVVGHIAGETEAKTFRVARFKSLRATEKPADTPEDFDLREHFGNAWSVNRGDHRYDIELKFEPEAAKVVTETIWHHTQKVKKQPGGRVAISFQVDGLDEILHWILTWAGKVTVIKPEVLRKKLNHTLKQALEMNSPPD